MHQFRRTKLSLVVILMLLVTAVTGDDTTSLTVRHGDDVTLPCGNVIEDQQKCDSTSWLFSHAGEAAVELVTLGNITENEKAKAKAKRLNVAEDCSLVIKYVKRDDVGRYICRQFRSGEQVSDAHQLLNVIEIEADDAFRFYCRVFRYGDCAHTVQWYYKGDETDISERQQHPCAAIVKFISPNVVQKSNFNELLFCNVTVKSGQTLMCNVDPGFPCEETGSTTSGGNQITEDETLKKPGWIRFIIVSVGLAVLIIISVTVSIWARTKENKTQMDHNAVENDEGEASVIYENSGGHDASVRFQ